MQEFWKCAAAANVMLLGTIPNVAQKLAVKQGVCVTCGSFVRGISSLGVIASGFYREHTETRMGVKKERALVFNP